MEQRTWHLLFVEISGPTSVQEVWVSRSLKKLEQNPYK